MSNRPTPEQIAATEGVAGQNVLDLLAHHGHVIVHPEDVAAALVANMLDGFVEGRVTIGADELLHHVLEALTDKS